MPKATLLKATLLAAAKAATIQYVAEMTNRLRERRRDGENGVR